MKNPIARPRRSAISRQLAVRRALNFAVLVADAEPLLALAPPALTIVDQRAGAPLSAVAGHQRRHHVVFVERDERRPGRALGVPPRQRRLRVTPGPAAARRRGRAAAARVGQQAQVRGANHSGHRVHRADVRVAEQLRLRAVRVGAPSGRLRNDNRKKKNKNNPKIKTISVNTILSL